MKFKHYKIVTILCLVICVVFLMSIISIAAEVWEFKLGAKMPETRLEAQALKSFMASAEEKSGGRIKFVSYFGGTLGGAKEQLENVVTGVQDFFAETYTYLAPFVDGFRVHSIPFFFSDNEEYQKFLLGPIEKEMEQALIDKVGLRVMNEKKNWLRGPYRIIASKKPILTLEDVKGVKLRQPDNQATIKLWNAFGASVIVLPYSEVYLALQQGMVNAVTIPITNYDTDKFYELAKHATITNEYQQQLVIVMNEKRFQSLPEDIRQILFDTINEAGDLCTKIVNDAASTVKDKLVKEGVTFHTVDLTPWREKAIEVQKQLEEEGFLPAGLMEKIKAQ